LQEGEPGLIIKSFNPRARVGRDLQEGEPGLIIKSFNPRARVGRDGSYPVLYSSDSHVSIHAPAWGATYATMASGLRCGRFNPRARVGRDLFSGLFQRFATCFNPRARVGRDLTPVSLQPRFLSSFNPRARVGRDFWLIDQLGNLYSFNPRARVGRDSICSML